MKQVVFTAALILVQASFLALAASQEQARPDAFLELQKGWKARSDKVARAEIQWDLTQTVCKESIALGYVGSENRGPSANVTFTGKCRASIDGAKIRYEYTGQHWSYSEHQVKNQSFVEVYDGSRFAHTDIESSMSTHPQVIISQMSVAEAFRQLSQQPIWYSCRWPLLAKIFPYLHDFQATGAVVPIRNHPCIELARVDAKTGLRTSIFVDPTFDNQIVRETETRGESVEQSMEIHYQENKVLGWVPKSWDYVTRNFKGLILCSGHGSLSDIIVNPEIASSAFEPVFLPGAHVIEANGRQETHYGINPDGSKGKAIDASGRIIQYEDLFDKPVGRRWLRFSLIVLLLIIPFVALLVHRRSRRLRGSTSTATNS